MKNLFVVKTAQGYFVSEDIDDGTLIFTQKIEEALTFERYEWAQILACSDDRLVLPSIVELFQPE